MGEKQKYVMALDQGTTSSRCILFDHSGEICSLAQKEYTQYYPKPGWVEHNPREIWSSQLSVAIEAMAEVGATASDIAANQRETTIVWDKKTGEPVYPAIVWQCRRTADLIDNLLEKGYGEKIKEKTGLVADAYFSASKIAWILDHVEGARTRAQKGAGRQKESKGGRASLRDGRDLADLEADGGQGARDGLFQCLQNHAFQHS